MFYWGLAIGLFVGCFVGIVISSLCVVSAKADDYVAKFGAEEDV